MSDEPCGRGGFPLGRRAGASCPRLTLSPGPPRTRGGNSGSRAAPETPDPSAPSRKRSRPVTKTRKQRKRGLWTEAGRARGCQGPEGVRPPQSPGKDGPATAGSQGQSCAWPWPHVPPCEEVSLWPPAPDPAGCLEAQDAPRQWGWAPMATSPQTWTRVGARAPCTCPSAGGGGAA